MRVITLTTDFGCGDFEIGTLKGVIWKIAPHVKIADLSHEIHPQNVLEGALLLGRCTPYFPKGSIHVAVIDPGVGTERQVIAARCGTQWFVGPDNGLLTLMLERAGQQKLPVEVVRVDQPKYWLPVISNVFHGRDIFAPVAAHLANGVTLSEIGTTIDHPLRLEIPQPKQYGKGWEAQVMNVDHFGNLATNLSLEHLIGLGEPAIRVGEVLIHGLSQTFGDRPPGSLVALINSEGYLEIARVNGSAARHLNVVTGDRVEVLPIDDV